MVNAATDTDMAQQNTADKMAPLMNDGRTTVTEGPGDSYYVTTPKGSGPAPDAVQVWMDHHDGVQVARLGEQFGQVQYQVEVLF